MEEPITPNTENMPKKKSVYRKILIGALILFVAASFSGLIYLQLKLQDTNQEKEALKKEATSVKLRLEELQEQTGGSGIAVNNGSTDDNDAIVKAAIANARATKGSENASVNAAVDKKELPFARAQVWFDTGSVACFFKKVDGVWLQLYCAQQVSDRTKQQDALYGVPESIIRS